MARPRENVEERFWRYVKKTRGCWNWTGSKFRRGYGQFMIDKKNLRAHRVSYRLYCGPIPEGYLVCHTCDNPPCVNPKHLYLGTWKSNVADMIKKGRKADTSGENNGQAKITRVIAEKIRADYAKNTVTGRYHRKKFSQAKLGRKYGISQTVVCDIVNEDYWRPVRK